MEEVGLLTAQARALTRKRKFDEAIEVVKDAKCKVERIEQQKKAFELKLEQTKWTTYETVGNLVEAYQAAKNVVDLEDTEENNKRLADLLIRMRYNKEAKARLTYIESRFGCEQWIQEQKLFDAFDSSVVLELKILKWILFCMRRKSSSIKSAGMSRVLSLCKATAQHIPQLYTLQLNQPLDIHLLRRMGLERAVLSIRQDISLTHLKLLKTLKVKHLTIQMVDLSNGKVLKIDSLHTLIVSREKQWGECRVDVTGLTRLVIAGSTEQLQLCGDLNAIESLTLAKCGDPKIILGNHYTNLKHFRLNLANVGPQLESFLTKHAATLRYLTLPSEALEKYVTAIAEILPNLHTLQVLGSKLQPQTVHLLREKLSNEKCIRIPE